MPPNVLTVPQVAALCGVPLRTVQYHVQKGALVARRYGLRRFIIDRTEAEKYARECWGVVLPTSVIAPWSAAA